MGAFKNRAFHSYRTEENTAVRAELKRAGIPQIALPAYMHTEVKTNVIGLLNGFVFHREWRYWVCTGDMPLDCAHEIFEEMSHWGVQAAGSTLGSKPSGYCPKMQNMMSEKAEELQAAGYSTNEVIAELEKLQDQENPSWPRFVQEYHIDTSEGLEAFAAYIFNNNVHAHNGKEGSYAADMFTRKDGM